MRTIYLVLEYARYSRVQPQWVHTILLTDPLFLFFLFFFFSFFFPYFLFGNEETSGACADAA